MSSQCGAEAKMTNVIHGSLDSWKEVVAHLFDTDVTIIPCLGPDSILPIGNLSGFRCLSMTLFHGGDPLK